MRSTDLTSCVKKSVFGGYTLKEKHFTELVRNIEYEVQHQKQLAKERDTLKQALQQAELKNQQYECQNNELTLKLHDADVLLKEERLLNAKQKLEFDELAQKLNDLETKTEKSHEDESEKPQEMEADLQQIKEQYEELTAKHQVELDQQKQEYEQTIERLQNEKLELEQQKEDALFNMSTVHKAQTMTEKRRKQLENELAQCQRELEKEMKSKFELEQLLKTAQGGNNFNVCDLLHKLELAVKQEEKAVEELNKYRDQIKNSQVQLKDALLGGQSQEKDWQNASSNEHGDARTNSEV
ncbi:hypothetical protein M3Y97_00186100 [Aphelenchoides bicaudatus]|nr:hypothetical protein M3Y97_00186100 [Aphelenchoides bicaudatus]